MRWVSPIVYSILLLLGFWVITARQHVVPGQLVAVRDLAAGRQLEPGDVVVAGGDVQYLKRGLKTGEALKPGDVSSFPPFNLDEGMLPIVFAVGAGLVESGDMNAGAQVQICKGSEAKLKPVPVKAVVCDSPATVCWAIVGVPADQSAGLADLFVKTPLPSLKVVHANSTC
jgi:hypothetical protein